MALENPEPFQFRPFKQDDSLLVALAQSGLIPGIMTFQSRQEPSYVKPHSFTAIVQKDHDAWISLCPELDVASQGESIEEAKANLREAVELFLETASPKELDQRFRSETYLSQLEVNLG